MKKSRSSLSIQSLLELMTKRLCVAFAVACAEEAMAKIKEPKPEALRALALAKRYSLGEDVGEQELRDAAADAAYAAYAAHAANAANVAYAAAYAAYAAADAANAAAYAAYAAYSVYYSAKSLSKPEDYFKPLLLNMIKKEFTEFELIMIGIL